MLNPVSTVQEPYAARQNAVEFIPNEVEKGLKNGTITVEPIDEPIDFSLILSSFGSDGVQTVKQMVQALAEHSLQMTFSHETRTFKVLASSELSRQFLLNIFQRKRYVGWVPQVNEVDSFGNRLVTLFEYTERDARLSREYFERDLEACWPNFRKSL